MTCRAPLLGNTLEHLWNAALAASKVWRLVNACAQEIVFFEQGEPMVDGDTGDLKVSIGVDAHEAWSTALPPHACTFVKSCCAPFGLHQDIITRT